MKTITKEQLIEYGFKPTLDPVSTHQKIIGENEDGRLVLVVTWERNVAELALSLPDGGMLFLRPTSLEHLHIFEQCIESWSPNY